MNSLTINITSAGQLLDKVLASNIQNHSTIPLLDSISSGGVHYNHLYPHKILGLTLPPSTMSRFNSPCLRLYTGLRHGPCAANLHQLTHLNCGTWHQPQAPNQFTGSESATWVHYGLVVWYFVSQIVWIVSGLSISGLLDILDFASLA